MKYLFLISLSLLIILGCKHQPYSYYIVSEDNSIVSDKYIETLDEISDSAAYTKAYNDFYSRIGMDIYYHDNYANISRTIRFKLINNIGKDIVPICKFIGKDNLENNLKRKIDSINLYITSSAIETDNSQSISSTPQNSEIDPYVMMHKVFTGNPEIYEIKPMFESIMKTYGYENNDDNRLKIASMLLELRKSGNGEIKEIDILKDIFYNGSNLISLPNQAAISYTLLISNKKK